MSDKEKVIERLKLLREHLWFQAEENKHYRQYYIELDSGALDAINLLKEQDDEIQRLRKQLDEAMLWR